MAKKIFLSPPHMTGDEQRYMQQAFADNRIAPGGPNVEAFEAALCEYTGAKYAVALNSGTAAIHLGLINLGVKAGDEVIVPSLTFVAAANPVVYQKAIPVFVDSEHDTWNISPEFLEAAIKDRIAKGRKPKAIIVVHIFGNVANMNRIMKLAEKYEIPVLEDAADALGSEYKERKAGTLGIMGVISFNGNKIITASGGGALITDNKEYADKARFLASQAKDPAPFYQHSQIGYNYAFSNVLAGIGLAQIKAIDERVEKRRANFNFYKNAFKNIREISFPGEHRLSKSNRWLSCIMINRSDEHRIDRDILYTLLAKEEIESRPMWKPMHIQPIFRQYPYYGNGVAEELFNKGLCLPSGSSLSDADLERICKLVKKEFRQSVIS